MAHTYDRDVLYCVDAIPRSLSRCRGAGVYGGAPYTFEFVVDDAWSVAPYSASPTIWPTHIPKLKYAENWAYSTDGMAFDPVLKADCQEKAGDTILDTDPTGNFGVVYSQPSVVHLTGSSGGHIGWLLLLNRARSWVYSHNGDTAAPAFDAGGDPEESSGSSFWDVVGYFDPGLEPTFSTGDTIGPFLLVSGDCRCSVGVEPHLGAEGSKQDLLTWVGTCGGVEMEVDGDLWLYLYYDVDTPSALSGGVTYSDTQNKIRGAAREPYPATMGPDALDDSFLFGKYIAAGDGSICVRRIRITDLQDEFNAYWSRWSAEGSSAEYAWTAESVVKGESLGPIRPWMAVGDRTDRLLIDFRGWLNFAENDTVYGGINAFDSGNRDCRTRVCDAEPRLHSSSGSGVDPTTTPLSLFFSAKPLGTPDLDSSGPNDVASMLPLGRGFWQAWAIDGAESFNAYECPADNAGWMATTRTTVFGVDFVVAKFYIDKDGAYEIHSVTGDRIRARDQVMASSLTATTTTPTTTTTYAAIVDWADSAPQIVPKLSFSTSPPPSYRVLGGGFKTLNDIADPLWPISAEGLTTGAFNAERTWQSCWKPNEFGTLLDYAMSMAKSAGLGHTLTGPRHREAFVPAMHRHGPPSIRSLRDSFGSTAERLRQSEPPTERRPGMPGASHAGPNWPAAGTSDSPDMKRALHRVLNALPFSQTSPVRGAAHEEPNSYLPADQLGLPSFRTPNNKGRR